MSNDSFNDTMFLDADEKRTVMTLRIISSVLSMIGSTFIISVYIALSIMAKCNRGRSATIVDRDKSKAKVSSQEEYNKLKMGYGHDLIFFLAISDLIRCISTFIKTSDFSNSEIDAACIAQGFFLNFSEMSSICWTSVIAFSIYIGTRKNTDVVKYSQRYLFFFIYSYGVPLIFTIGPLATNSIGPAGAWCWLNTQNLENSSAWIWSLLIYIINWTNILFNLIAVIFAVRYFKIRAFEIKEGDQKQANFLRNFCIVLKFFPIILIVCWIFPTINRIVLFATREEHVGLYSVSAFFACMQGFLNAIVYSYYYKNILGSCCRKKIAEDNRDQIKNMEMNTNNFVPEESLSKEHDESKEVKNIQSVEEIKQTDIELKE